MNDVVLSEEQKTEIRTLLYDAASWGWTCGDNADSKTVEAWLDTAYGQVVAVIEGKD